MSPTIEEQIEKLKSTISEMEAQREALGDAVVQSAIAPLQQKLDDLTRVMATFQDRPSKEPAQKRKLLTILFMDIVGSTAMIQNLDPEDVSQLIDHNLKRLAQPITEFGGHITSFTGDGFMAIFGVPSSQEDDPERAVRAGLAVLRIAEEIAGELKQDWGIEAFNLRVGIHTGLVLLGGETEGPDTTKGPAVQLAARLQSTAPSGGLLVSHDTYRHIRGVFDVEAWEPLKVKGFDLPVRAYRVLSAKPRAFRSYTRGVEGVETRMVGRHDELKYLQDAFLTAVEDHEGQIVTILGEAGVGKSRLLYEFQNWIELQPTQVWFYEGKAHQEALGMPLDTLRDLFEFRFQLQESDTQEIAREKVERGFCAVFGSTDEAQMRAHILGQWLGFDFSLSPHLKGVLTDPEQLRNRGVMYLDEYFKTLGKQQPLVIFMEDIHWADDSSLDALNWLGERIQHQPLLIVCAARTSLRERRPYWGEGLSYHHSLALQPLSKRESHQLVDEILQLANQVPAELSALIVEGAEGNPFYVEELVKMLVEDGVVVKGEEAWQIKTERLPGIKVPPTLAGVLQARLESLPPEEQEVLQQASVVGRLFWDQAVAHIQAAEHGKPQAVPQALGSLRGREMVYRRETSAFAESQEYLFKHDILREVTYESVLKRLRRKYHGLVADWLKTQVEDRMGEFSGLIAGHLLQAGRKDEAGLYFLRAGQAALASFANKEAEKYLRQGIEFSISDNNKATCLADLGLALWRQGFTDEAVEKTRQSIEIYSALGESDMVARLYTLIAQALWYKNYQKSWDVCQEGLNRLEGAPESPGMARLLAEAGRAAIFLAKPQEDVILLCRQAMEMANRQGELEANLDAMMSLVHETNDFDEQIRTLRQVLAVSEENKLWRQAERACTNLCFYFSQSLQSLKTSYQYAIKAIDICIRVGNLETLSFNVDNLLSCSLDLGRLNSLEAEIEEILHASIATPSWINEYLERARSASLYYLGEWYPAIEFWKHFREASIESRQLQIISQANFALANNYLELNRFENAACLKEAQAALQENIEINWLQDLSLLYQPIISARLGRIQDAHERLNDALKRVDQPKEKPNNVYNYQAEAEIARAEGDWEIAVRNYQALIGIWQSGGFRWQCARQLIDLGDSLIGRNQPGDLQQAEKIYRHALELFTAMGAPGYIRVLEERLGIALAKK